MTTQTPEDQPFGNVSKSSRTPECPCGCHFSDFDYRGGKDCAMCGDNHTPFAATKGTPTEIVEELRGNPPHQEQESNLHRHFYKCIGCDASIGSIEEHVRNLQELSEAALALSTSTNSASETDAKPSPDSTLEENIRKTLAAWCQTDFEEEATHAILSLYQKELESLKEALPEPRKADHDPLCQHMNGSALCDCGARANAAYNRALIEVTASVDKRIHKLGEQP